MAHIEKRVSPVTGAITYKAQVRKKGHPTITASFRRKTDADRWVKDIENQIEQGRFNATAQSRKRTLSDLIKEYRAHTSPKIVEDRDHLLRWWESHYGSRLLSELRQSDIADGKRKLLDTTVGKEPVEGEEAKKLQPATVRRYQAAISAVLTYGVKELQWLQDNPARNVAPPAINNARTRFLNDDERDRLLAACDRSKGWALSPMVILAISTGMRLGEIQGLHWKEPVIKPKGAWGIVDLQNKAISLKNTKNGDTRRVPLTGRALASLQGVHKLRRRVDTHLVFPGHSAKPKSANDVPVVKPFDHRPYWEKALEVAGIENFKFHDLRHTFASYLAMNGASPTELAITMGHKSLAMVARYAHLSDSHTRSVVERMNSKIFGGSHGE